jgi:hypothetical protein
MEDRIQLAVCGIDKDAGVPSREESDNPGI